MRTRVLLIYDIENDRVRGKIADACLDYGLDRVQYSAFELMLRIASLLGERSGNIKLIPISARDWSDRQEIDQ
jgi:CRISPR-associated protein Cas2